MDSFPIIEQKNAQYGHKFV